MGRLSRTGKERTRWIIPVIIAALAFVAFLPALENGFVVWDDDKNFLNNPHYRGLGWSQLGWMWTTFRLGHYVPLSWMTLGLDYVVWGMNPFGYHLTSLLLHAVNAVLVYLLARRLLSLSGVATSDDDSVILPAAFAALLFAVHPLRVESVAWVTERRDVLSLFFLLSTVLAYLRAVEGEGWRRRWYWMSVLLFVCALLSKATAMTLPAVLLILNVYPLRRLGASSGWKDPEARRVYLYLVPFVVFSAATVALSIVALEPPPQLGLAQKVAVSAYSLVFYLWKTVVPVGLSPLYQMPQRVEPAAAIFVLSYLAAIALAGLAWVLRRRWPAVTTALLVFVVITLPMLGVVQNGPQIAADRYTYHAMPALAILAGAGFALLARHSATAVRLAAAGILMGLGALSWRQTRIWHDSESLWSHASAVDPASSIAQSGLSSALFVQGRVAEATVHGEMAVALAPEDPEAQDALGVALARQSRFPEAIAHYERALAIKPTLAEAHNNWGVSSAQQGDVEGAIAHFRKALELSPDSPDAQVNWGNALLRLNRPKEAMERYAEAVRIRPDHGDAHHNWGVALAIQGRMSEAVEQFREAVRINPEDAQARQSLEHAMQLLQEGPTRE